MDNLHTYLALAVSTLGRDCEAHAVSGFYMDAKGQAFDEFQFACSADKCIQALIYRDTSVEPNLIITHHTPYEMRLATRQKIEYFSDTTLVVGETSVEMMRFLIDIINDTPLDEREKVIHPKIIDLYSIMGTDAARSLGKLSRQYSLTHRLDSIKNLFRFCLEEKYI